MEKPEQASSPAEEIAIEKGDASPAQIQEIVDGQYHTIKELSSRVVVGAAWVSYLCQQGRIKAIKPLGRQWRIPASEFNRILTEGLPPLPRKKPEQSDVQVIQVPPDKQAKVKPPDKPQPEEKKKKDWFPISFNLFGEDKDK